MPDHDRTPAASSRDGAPDPQLTPPHRHRIRRVIGLTQVVLAVVTAVVVTVAYRNIDGNIAPGEAIQHVVRPPSTGEAGGPAEDEPTRPMNVLVMGSDSREGEGNSIDGESGGGGSDTTILLHVSADREQAYGVSLPRDALVTRPDCTDGDGEAVPGGELEMFNAAFALAGPLCTVAQVESLTGIYIDHYLVLDFNGFKDMVEAVRGVEVCIPREVSDPEHNIFFDPGVQTLTGQQALNYVRERYVLSQTGDIGRMKRQQAFIASMTNKVVSAGTLSRPTRVYDFLSAATSSIVVDEDLDSVGELVDLALQFRRTGLSEIKFLTVPFEAYEPDPNRLVWADGADRLWKRIKRDKPLGAELSEGSLSAADSVGTASGTASPTPSPTDGPSDGPSDGTDRNDELSEEDRAARLAAGLCT